MPVEECPSQAAIVNAKRDPTSRSGRTVLDHVERCHTCRVEATLDLVGNPDTLWLDRVYLTR